MTIPQMVMYDEELTLIKGALGKLIEGAHARAIFLMDRNGHLISCCGETERYDTTSLASLTAGAIAATGGLAKLIGEKEFPILFHQGDRENLHISIVGTQVILVVIFDQRSSLGLVRHRVRKASEELAGIFDRITKMSEEKERNGERDLPFAEITDDDIETLFP